MASAHNHHHNQASTSKPTKMDFPTLPASFPHSQFTSNPTSIAEIEDKDSKPGTTGGGGGDGDGDQLHSLHITTAPEDVYLSKSSHLTRQEVLKRRSHNLKQLSKCYRDHYWALMEEVRAQYREYLWNYGMSPFKEDEEKETAKDAGDGFMEGSGESNANASNHLCAFYGCKLKAMALTSFCHLHILSDAKQQLYKPCNFVIKSAQAGPITCGKPILRSTAPSLCTVHFQKAQKHISRALKKAGLNINSSTKFAPKFRVIVTKYVREIQSQRRTALEASKNNVVVKQERAS